MFQPEGYRTMYTTIDYDDTYEAPHHQGYDSFSSSTWASEMTQLGGAAFAVLDQAEVVNINDNGTKLFDLVRLSDELRCRNK